MFYNNAIHTFKSNGTKIKEEETIDLFVGI